MPAYDLTDYRGRPLRSNDDDDGIEMLLASFQQDFIPLIPETTPPKQKRTILIQRVSVSPRKRKRNKKKKKKSGEKKKNDDCHSSCCDDSTEPDMDYASSSSSHGGPTLKIGRAKKDKDRKVNTPKRQWMFWKRRRDRH